MNNKYNYTEDEAIAYAKGISQTVVIRSYINGNSRDDLRETCVPEANIISSAVAGALLAVRWGCDMQSAKDTAEFIANRAWDELWGCHNPSMNGYDSVYIPIGIFLRDHEVVKAS